MEQGNIFDQVRGAGNINNSETSIWKAVDALGEQGYNMPHCWRNHGYIHHREYHAPSTAGKRWKRQKKGGSKGFYFR